MRINGEAWPRAVIAVALLATAAVLAVYADRELALMLLTAAIAYIAPAPSWTRKSKPVPAATLRRLAGSKSARKLARHRPLLYMLHRGRFKRRAEARAARKVARDA